ncbi:MAG: hypothetical protein ACI85F_000120 [Bacteroidia bacterium]|jgi:hypothetical protein
MIPLLPAAYFAPISYYGYLVESNFQVGINENERFQKQTIRNRAEILGANGKIRLTVPLIKWSTKVPTKEIRIDNSSNWKHVHWMSIQSAYRNSAFFEHYEDKIKAFFIADYEHLIDLNIASLQLATSLLNADLSIENISDSDNLDKALFEDLKSKFIKKRLNKPSKTYPQVFSDRFDFFADLSILDLLFNLGPRASIYLQNQHKIS